MSELQESVNPADQQRIASDSVPSHYFGAKVSVYYGPQSGLTDNGTVVFISNHWIELSKDKGERLLIPLAGVRLVKLLEPNPNHKEATTLLRASLPPPSDKD